MQHGQARTLRGRLETLHLISIQIPINIRNQQVLVLGMGADGRLHGADLGMRKTQLLQGIHTIVR